MEGVGVGHIVDEHDQVGFAEQLEGDLFEDVLASYIDKVELHSLVRSAFNGNLLDVIFTSLCHHIVMVETLLDHLINQACLAYSWLSRYDHSCT